MSNIELFCFDFMMAIALVRIRMMLKLIQVSRVYINESLKHILSIEWSGQDVVTLVSRFIAKVMTGSCWLCWDKSDHYLCILHTKNDLNQTRFCINRREISSNLCDVDSELFRVSILCILKKRKKTIEKSLHQDHHHLRKQRNLRSLGILHIFWKQWIQLICFATHHLEKNN